MRNVTSWHWFGVSIKSDTQYHLFELIGQTDARDWTLKSKFQTANVWKCGRCGYKVELIGKPDPTHSIHGMNCREYLAHRIQDE